MHKRKLEVVVISDVHLGTDGCHAKQLLTYLNSIKPKKLILNGDIVDIWQFNKQYFPKSHLKVVKKILDMAAKGTEVIYITGNHDGMLRKFSDCTIGNISIVEKYILNIDGKKAWIFHGDIFDISVKHAKWLATLGGYGLLTNLNKMLNFCLVKLGREKYSFLKKLKSCPKSAANLIKNFEETATGLALQSGFDYVICGHIHQPKMLRKENDYNETQYLNSGDWVENLTALEYQFKRWKIYRYNEDKLRAFYADEDIKTMSIDELIGSITRTEEAILD